jgi:ADP-ribosylation factor-like protein 8
MRREREKIKLNKGHRFVVDAADHDKLEAAKSELKALLDRPQLVHIPLLILGNKNDLQGALTAEQLIDIL